MMLEDSGHYISINKVKHRVLICLLIRPCKLEEKGHGVSVLAARENLR